MKISISVIFVLFSSNILALTEVQFIDKVLSRDTHFEKDKIYVTIKQIELDASKRTYAGWNTGLSAGLSNSYYVIDKDTTSTSIYEKYRLKNNKSIGLRTTKRFLSNPASLTLSARRSIPDADIQRYKKDKPYTGSNAKYSITTFDNTYIVSYKYPLLRHDDNAKSLKTYRRNILDLEREELDFYDAQEGFLVDRLEQYIDWNFYQKNANIYQHYKQSLATLEANKAEDVSKLNTAILLANQDVLSNDSKLQSLKKALVISLNDPSLWSQSPKIKTNKRPKIMSDLEQYLHHNVRFLLKLDIDKKLKKIDLDYYKNQSLFKLDLSINAEKNDNKGNTLSTNYSNKSVLYTASIDFNAPIGTDVNNQKNIRVAQLNLRKINIDYDNKLKDITSDVEAFILELHLAKETLDAYQKVINNVTSESNLAFKNYLNKAVAVKTLIATYQEKRDVELDYVKAFTDYQESLLKYNDKLDRVLRLTKIGS